jgi:hypothetical protein
MCGGEPAYARALGCGDLAAPLTRGDGMPTVIGHHDVKDTEYWLASPKRES